MSSKVRPYVLYVAEAIYLEICKIKKKNPVFSNIDAIDAYIGSEEYSRISSGKFHDEWFAKLKINLQIPIQKKRFPKKHLSYSIFKKT